MIEESRRPAFWVFIFSFLVSFFTMMIYLSETGLADEELLLLLAILRYSSFTVCVSSIFLFIIGIISLTKKITLISILQVVFSVLGVFYGAGIIIVDAFIATITGGQS